MRGRLSGCQTEINCCAPGIYIVLRHDATAHPYRLRVAWILRRPIRPACNRVEIEVVLSWIGGNVPHPLRQAGALVLTRDEISHHVRIVRRASHVWSTFFGVRTSCVDQARRVAPTEANHGRPAALFAIAIARPMNVRRNEWRLA